MNGPFADKYWKAAEKEIDTLEGMGARDVVECEDDMNVINRTWAFKRKQFPNGTVKKFKATSDKGLIMKFSKKLLKIDSFLDANFLGCTGMKLWMIQSV